MSYTLKSNISYQGKVDEDGDPDLVYYNADIINNSSKDPVGSGDTNVIKFIETRSVPIINNVSKFEFSIIRFTMNGPNKDLPILIPTIEIGQNDINKTTYNITINMSKVFKDNAGNIQTFNGSASRYVEYQTETTAFTNNNLPLPQPPKDQQDTRGNYYWIYTYDHFCYLINNTIQLLFQDLQTAYTAYQATFPAPSTNPTIISQPPQLVYNESSTLFSIYYDAYGWGDKTTNNSLGTGADETFTMSFNNNLFNLLSNFDNNYVGIIPNSETNQLLVVNKNWKNFVPPPNTTSVPNIPQPSKFGYWEMVQGCNSTSTLWCPVSSIVFTSTLIPIYPEQVGQPTVFGDSNDLGFSSSTSAFQPIITDIALPMATAHDYREFIEYAPTAEYRMSAFTRSKQSLSNIDVQVFWKNRLDNSLYPVRMTNYSSVSIKIMFRKKTN